MNRRLLVLPLVLGCACSSCVTYWFVERTDATAIAAQDAAKTNRMISVEVYQHDGESADQPYARDVEYAATVACLARDTGILLHRDHAAHAAAARFELPVPPECEELNIDMYIRPSHERCNAAHELQHIRALEPVSHAVFLIECESLRLRVLRREALPLLQCNESETTIEDLGQGRFHAQGCEYALDLQCVDEPGSELRCEPGSVHML